MFESCDRCFNLQYRRIRRKALGRLALLGLGFGLASGTTGCGILDGRRSIATTLACRSSTNCTSCLRWSFDLLELDQLAFILLNIAGLADRQHPDREIADLLFFPTGGGKTEAYLGLAAFVIAHRRLSGPGVLGFGF
jgi:hypothetical protein